MRQSRKLYPAIKYTNPNIALQLFASSMWISYCKQTRTRYVQTLLPDVVAPETHWNSLCELKTELRVTTQEFCAVGGYMEDLTNHRTVKVGGMHPCSGMGACTGQYGSYKHITPQDIK